MRRPRAHTVALKAKEVIAALKGNQTLIELAEKFDVHPNRITQWKIQFLKNTSGGFVTVTNKQAANLNLQDLHAAISQQALEIIFFGALSRIGDAGAKR